MSATRRKSSIVHRPPEGFKYKRGIVSPDEEAELIRHIEKLPLKEFEFHGYYGKRRTISFGWHYDFAGASLDETEAIPDFLALLRVRAAEFAQLNASDLPHVLVTEYSTGAPIGWHRDKAVFDEVVGISLLSRCTFRFRKKTDTVWERHTVLLEPRSVYLLTGSARSEWEHSIPPVDELRYSITFRRLKS